MVKRVSNKQIKEQLDNIQNTVNMSNEKIISHVDNIKIDMRALDKKQTNNQKIGILISIAVTYAVLGVTTLFVINNKMATLWFSVICILIAAAFMVIGLKRPKWLMK